MGEDHTLDVMAIGAHPDDVEFSCGGTLLKLVSLGYRVGILDMARGEMGTRGTAETRLIEAGAAAKVLGLAVRDNAELPDGRIWPQEEYRVLLARKIRCYRPRIIFTHYWQDPHPDHAHTSQLVREAAHVSGLAKYDAEQGQPRHRPNCIAHFLFPRTVVPTFIVDITQFAELKREAALCYRSQLYNSASKEPETEVSSESFLSRIEATQRYFGGLIGVTHGEAFVVREAINVDDPVALLTRRMNMYS